MKVREIFLPEPSKMLPVKLDLDGAKKIPTLNIAGVLKPKNLFTDLYSTDQWIAFIN